MFLCNTQQISNIFLGKQYNMFKLTGAGNYVTINLPIGLTIRYLIMF